MTDKRQNMDRDVIIMLSPLVDPEGYERVCIALPPMDRHDYFTVVDAVSRELATAKPWTLVEMPGESYSPLISKRFTLLARVRTWWLNIGRRKHAAKMRRAMAFYFSPEQVCARAVGNSR